MRHKHRGLALIALIAGVVLVTANSPAFTAGLRTAAAPVTGYGALPASDPTLVRLGYTLTQSNPPTVATVTVVMAGNTLGSNASLGFNASSHAQGTATATCTSASLVDVGTHTSYVCDVSALGLSVANLHDADVALSPSA